MNAKWEALRERHFELLVFHLPLRPRLTTFDGSRTLQVSENEEGKFPS
jgi:hypothetical protein